MSKTGKLKNEEQLLALHWTLMADSNGRRPNRPGPKRPMQRKSSPQLWDFIFFSQKTISLIRNFKIAVDKVWMYEGIMTNDDNLESNLPSL